MRYRIYNTPMILMLAALPISVSGANCIESHKIQPLFDPSKEIAPEHLQLTTDSVLVSQYTTLVELNFDGTERQSFRFENGEDIANFSYLSERDLIAIVLWLGEDVYRKPIFQTRFYDRVDQSYFVGRDPFQASPDFSYFKQFISTTEGRLFVNRWTLKNMKVDGPLLQEVDLVPTGGGYEISPRGDPFHLQRRDFDENRGSFKRRWIIANGDELLVINAVQPVLKRYNHRNNDKRNDLVEKETYISLEAWVHPYQKSNNLPWKKWYYSFSQNVGFDKLGPNLLLWSYITPFIPSKGRNADDGAPTHILNLQVLQVLSDGQIPGHSVAVPGGQLIGVSGRIAYVLLPRDKSAHYYLCQIEF